MLEKEGKKKQVTIKTEELTKARLGEIANHYTVMLGLPPLEKRTEGVFFASILESETQVSARKITKTSTPASENQAPETNRVAVILLELQQEYGSGLPIIAAGINTEDGSKLWKIKDLFELGLAVKLYSSSGKVDILIPNSGDFGVLSLSTTTNDEINRHMLFN